MHARSVEARCKEAVRNR
uniref:Uncharacterized protein n=1 Tax=Anguilla anguilla TaxID=7936 RepID=A0A0E9VV90_ANGAN